MLRIIQNWPEKGFCLCCSCLLVKSLEDFNSYETDGNLHSEELSSRVELGTRVQETQPGAHVGTHWLSQVDQKVGRVGERWTLGTLPEAMRAHCPETEDAFVKG